jgi:cellulose biosynthesis protein BcsQ
MDIHSFTSKELLEEFMNQEKFDAILIDEKVRAKELNLSDCSFAYLVDAEEISILDGVKAISRYQKVEGIFKSILDLVSDRRMNEEEVIINQKSNSKMITFLSGGSGSGNSTIAAAYCLTLKDNGHRVLFLNLDPFGISNVFYNGEGNQCLSDLIITIKNKRGNFTLKLESAAKLDASGVYFLDETTSPLDLMELSPNEFSQLIEEIISCNLFDYVVADGNLINPNFLQVLMKRSYRTILVSKGSWVSNSKLNKLIHLMNSISDREKMDLNGRMHILYNQFSTGSSRRIEVGEVISCLGEIPKYNCHSSKDLAHFLSNGDELRKLKEFKL